MQLLSKIIIWYQTKKISVCCLKNCLFASKDTQDTYREIQIALLIIPIALTWRLASKTKENSILSFLWTGILVCHSQRTIQFLQYMLCIGFFSMKSLKTYSIQFLANESTLIMMKSAFYFTLRYLNLFKTWLES